ncbi:hypothetical protein Q4I28_003071 [Leishmania naiffi]|uniref:LisH domain-containing protein n=1 Tax=Leishmania naiffi TaxID=5678 RepID=A0AAW3BX68_9TRYP
MAAARQEMADLLREVQKVQKELQPVRSAVAVLQKREADTPNAAATGASLKKVATRLESVRHKYRPYLMRLNELLFDEVPAYLQQTALLAADAESPEQHPDGASRGRRNVPNERLNATFSSSVKSTNDDAAHLLQQVCPPSTPHLVQPENLRFTQQQLRLRTEIVEYLIETNRIDIAEHVVCEYGLPLQWFPRLVLLHRQRIFGTAIEGVESLRNALPPSATAGVTAATVTSGLSRSFPAPGVSLPVTPSTRPRASGAPPKSPILQQFSASSKSNATGVPAPSLPRSPAPRTTSASSAGASTPMGLHVNRSAVLTASSVIHSPPTPQQQQRESGVTSVFLSQGPSSTDTTGAAAAPVTMPDLVVRVVSAAMYLKDEYLDRMVLERTLEQHLGTAASSVSANAASTRGNSTSSPNSATSPDRYKACVLSRIANIPRHHLHTQSGDDAFDNAMMNIIEDLLVYGLQRWAEVDSATVADAEEAAAESKKKAELQLTLTTDTLLTPQEMLLADKVWNEDILFLKRPTRFYCVESGLSTDDGTASALAMPRARTNGEVVSKLVAVNHDALDSTAGIFIT